MEGDVYVALRFSEFSHNKAGYVVRLIPVWKGDVRYEEDKFYTERDYYVDGCGFDVLEQINGGNRPLVTLKGRILVRIV